jgi:hypothetical protein
MESISRMIQEMYQRSTQLGITERGPGSPSGALAGGDILPPSGDSPYNVTPEEEAAGQAPWAPKNTSPWY